VLDQFKGIKTVFKSKKATPSFPLENGKKHLSIKFTLYTSVVQLIG